MSEIFETLGDMMNPKKNQLEFFNTINIGGYELDDSIRGVKNQNRRILEIFKQTKQPMTPLQVHRVYCAIFPECPVTSIRRGITTLTDHGKLEKTDKKKNEQYGKVNHYWRIPDRSGYCQTCGGFQNPDRNINCECETMAGHDL